jgi:hypothetical protein
MKQCWPAPERNKGPILDVLTRVFPGQGRVLELASGSGQHAVHFARNLPQLTWQPSDIERENLDSITAWVKEAALPNLCLPITLDVCSPDWGVGVVDAAFNANMIHIAPWECCVALFEGLQRHLAPAGIFVLYGPFRIAGAHTASSNRNFDAGLKAQDHRWGLRDVEVTVAAAERNGLVLTDRIAMPANNQSLVFRHR